MAESTVEKVSRIFREHAHMMERIEKKDHKIYNLERENKALKDELEIYWQVGSDIGLPENASAQTTADTIRKLYRRAKDAEAENQPGHVSPFVTFCGRPITKALTDIVVVRKAQPYTEGHDDCHTMPGWASILADYFAGLYSVVPRYSAPDVKRKQFRDALVRIAALALAGAEAMDRKGVKER
jgi:hypothetical protein